MNTHQHQDSGGKHPRKSKSRQPHKDWRAWVVVGLMLAAMAAYVLSFDESIEPGTPTDQSEIPAATP